MAATLHIGTYDKNGGKGLVPVTLNPDGSLTAGEPLAEAANASFGVRAEDKAYLTDERDPGAISLLGRDGEGWRRLGSIPSAGAEPCFIECDGRLLAAANYASGSVAAWRLGDDDGMPVEPPAVFQSRGSGPNEERQEGPHAHCVRFSPDGQALYAVDLGVDTIWRLPLDRAPEFGPPTVAWRAPPGSGPRQLLFAPQGEFALLLSELASTVTLLDLAPDGSFSERQAVSTLPEGFKGESLGGHLELIGGRAVVSNRGHNSLAVFNLVDRKLELTGHVASGGAHPRSFAHVGDQLVVVHEKDGRVTSFDLAPGKLPAATGHSLRVPGACFVLA